MSAARVHYFCDSTYAGGAEEYLWMLATGLGPDEASLVVVDGPDLGDWITRWEERGHRVHRLRPAGTWSTVRQLHAFARRVRPELVHLNAPGPYAGALGLAPLALRCGGASRIVVTEHLPTVGRVGRRYWAKRLGVRSVDIAISVCQAHRQVLVDAFGYPESRAVAVSNGIADPQTEHAGDAAIDPLGDAAHPRFVQLGSLDPRKGGMQLLEAFASATAGGLAGTLHFVGEGPLREALAARIDALTLGDRVFLHGHRNDVNQILAHADVAVLASFREGLPLSLLEAMAHSLPIIGTSVDGVPELVHSGENGILVPSGDIGALAAALAELGADEKRCRAMGARSRERFVQEFTLERMRRETYALYSPENPDARGRS